MLPVITKVQSSTVLPGQTPFQLLKLEFAPGTAVKLIEVPDAKELPSGDCVIVPEPTTEVASVSCGCTGIPSPASGIANVPAFALVAIRSVAARSPNARGAKSTDTVHDAPIWIALQLPETVKSAGFAPPIVIPLMFNVAEAVVALEIVKVCGGLVLPTTVLGNARLDCEKLTMG